MKEILVADQPGVRNYLQEALIKANFSNENRVLAATVLLNLRPEETTVANVMSIVNNVMPADLIRQALELLDQFSLKIKETSTFNPKFNN